jgi:subtilisin family serine protease
MGGATHLMALRALNANGSGSPFNIAEAVRYASDQGAQVINLSLTLPVNYNPDDAAMLCRATDYAQSKGSLVVGASGNHSSAGVQPVSYPAACPGVLAVGASTREDTRATFSDAGSRLDLVAPGEGIYTTLRATNTSYGRWSNTGSGTSFAAPHASGAAALLRSLRPDLSPATVNDLLRSAADDVGDPGIDLFTGWGRLNVARSASKATDGLSLSVVAQPASVAAGESTEIRLQVSGPGGLPAGAGARISLASSLGLVSPTVIVADSDGAGKATFTAGAIPGSGSVTASLGGLSKTFKVFVTGHTVYLPLVAP